MTGLDELVGLRGVGERGRVCHVRAQASGVDEVGQRLQPRVAGLHRDTGEPPAASVLALMAASARSVTVTSSPGADRALAEEPTARTAVERMLRDAAAEYTEPSHPPGFLVINGAVNTTSAGEDVKRELRGVREAAKYAIAQKIDIDVRADLLPPETDSLALATFYAAVVQGMSTQTCDGTTHENLERVVGLAMTAWPT